jgi:hypothetical protein
VEALTSDYAGNLDSVSLVARSGLDVYAHNIETVERMTPFVRDRRANFRYTLFFQSSLKLIRIFGGNHLRSYDMPNRKVSESLKQALCLVLVKSMLTSYRHLKVSALVTYSIR